MFIATGFTIFLDIFWILTVGNIWGDYYNQDKYVYFNNGYLFEFIKIVWFINFILKVKICNYLNKNINVFMFFFFFFFFFVAVNTFDRIFAVQM